jgi:hypothetical protein
MNPLIGLLIFSVLATCMSAQTISRQLSDPQALSLAQKSIFAVTGGAAIRDITVIANVISVIGSDYKTGTGTFPAKGSDQSRSTLRSSKGTRTDVRSVTSGIPVGAWQYSGSAPTAYAQHNCHTEASWFFPGFFSLAQAANRNYVFRYIGIEQHNNVPVRHLRVFQVGVNDHGMLQRLSTTDYYLDASSYLPLAISFDAHADNNLSTNVPVEIDFANYRTVDGVRVPFHFQKLLNRGVILDATVTSVTFNTDLSDTLFSIQ